MSKPAVFSLVRAIRLVVPFVEHEPTCARIQPISSERVRRVLAGQEELAIPSCSCGLHLALKALDEAIDAMTLELDGEPH